MTVTFDYLDEGQYAVMAFHDLNGNSKLDTNIFGFPKEPWGGSLNVSRVVGKPKWEQARFELAEDDYLLTIKLK